LTGQQTNDKTNSKGPKYYTWRLPAASQCKTVNICKILILIDKNVQECFMHREEERKLTGREELEFSLFFLFPATIVG